MNLSDAIKRKKQKKAGKVMKEFYAGALHQGGSGKVVKRVDVAKAISMSKAGLSRR